MRDVAIIGVGFTINSSNKLQAITRAALPTPTWLDK